MELSALAKGRPQAAGAGCDRRTFLVAAGALLQRWALPAGAIAQERATSWEEAVQAVLGTAKPTEVKMLLEMPEIAENGNTVPFTVSLDNPMTDTDYVKAIHVFNEKNPQPNVIDAYFGPRAAKASFELAQKQQKIGTISAVALLNAEQTYLQAGITLVQAQSNRYADTAGLFQALGGGWWNRPEGTFK